MVHANIGSSFEARARCGEDLDTQYGTAVGPGHVATGNPDLVTCPACYETDAAREERILQEKRYGLIGEKAIQPRENR